MEPIFEVKLATPNERIELKNLTEPEARKAVADFAEKHKEDTQLKDYIDTATRYFGFCGKSGRGYECNISSRLPRVQGTEMHRCGRRDDMFSTGSLEKDPAPDRWDIIGNDKVCSYCGSLHPMRVIELLKKHGFGILGTTDKGYKWYINQPGVRNAGFGGIKYYRQHDTPEFIEAFNQLAKLPSTAQ